MTRDAGCRSADAGHRPRGDEEEREGHRPDRVAVAAGAALVLLAWALTATLRDLRSVPTELA
ncbi:hypothetical protein GCM10010430_70170 [Kitasatospora cystarginea]|uniref:Uncharacterized protein n=1 Tax=Kitasatospora cystarginea TaxID=58350 RepID=A0ABN3EWT2_9ACTN